MQRPVSKTVYVSAVEGTGLDLLRERIDTMIEEDPVSRVHLRVPQNEGKLLRMLEAQSADLLAGIQGWSGGVGSRSAGVGGEKGEGAFAPR